MTDRERMVLILAGVALALLVTSSVIYLAINATDSSERSLLIGALAGTGAFGGGALFAMLGVHSKPGAAVEVQPPATVNVNPPPEPPQGHDA